MKQVLKQFKVYAPPLAKADALNKDGTLTITGVASTTNQDLDGEVISEKALKSLQKQAVGLNLHLDHNHDYNGGIGAITEAHIEKNSLIITANVLAEHAEGIRERLNLGMNMGFSIGGIPIIKNSRSNIIDDFILLEISLTLLPANWDTFGTVEGKNFIESNCLTGACHYILSKKNKESKFLSDTMEEKAKQSGKVIDDATKQELVDIVNEAIINLKPLILDELKEEMVKLVQEVVATALGDVVPKAIDEIKAEALPPVEEEQEEEVPVEEKATEEEEVVEEEKATEEEEVVEEEQEEEVPVEEVVEEEKEVPSKVPVSGIPARPSDVSYAETTQNITAPTFTIDSKAVAEQVLAEVWKQLDAHRDTVQKDSKLEEYKTEHEITTKSKFLDSETRDKFGRNKKFL